MDMTFLMIEITFKKIIFKQMFNVILYFLILFAFN